MNFRYINTRNVYPYDRHLIEGLRENNHTVSEITENSPGIQKYIRIGKAVVKDKSRYNATIIGFPSPLFAIIVSAICYFKNQKVIFNAVSSQYEANIISRGVKKYSLAAFKWWIIDFLSFHLPWRTLLESDSQKKYVHNLVLVPKKKLVRSWTGVNEKEFFYISDIKKCQKFTVLFRGRFLPESGIDTVIRAAHLLENKNVKVRIIGLGFMYREVNMLMNDLKPKNIEMINETLSIEKLRAKMLECHISLGQLADHPRLSRTLPCKLFESLALGLPYLTGRNAGVLELLIENETCFAVESGNPNDLAQKILFLKNNPDALKRVARQGHQLYKEKLTSKQLAEEVIENCFKK